MKMYLAAPGDDETTLDADVDVDQAPEPAPGG
jgi:hypothetical protein